MKQELVKNWITQNVIFVRPGTSIPEADKMMTERGIRRLPVVDENGRLHSQYATDYLHINESGYQILNNTLTEVIESAITA